MSNGAYSEGGYLIGAPLEFCVKCVGQEALTKPALGIGIDNVLGQRIITLHSNFRPHIVNENRVSGEFQFVCRVEGLALLPGEYRVKLSLESGLTPVHVLEDGLSFIIISSDFYGNGGKMGRGLVLCNQSWDIAVQRTSPDL